MAENPEVPVKKKRGRPRKTPLIELPSEIEQIVAEVKEKEKQQQIKEIEEVKEEIRLQHNGNWDVTKDQIPKFFDADLSYEITGYRPINATKGLDFDPSWFTETRETFLRTGHYCQYPKNTKAYADFWTEEYKRCKYGMTSHGYTVTGDNYFFLNYYQLMDLDSAETAGEGRVYIFPNFYVGQYEWFHYVELCKKLRMNACLMKSREVGYSEIDSAIAVNNYNCRRNTVNLVVANLSDYLVKTLDKMWKAMSFLNDFTDGGFLKLRQVIDRTDFKRASVNKIINGQKVETGWMSQIQGIIADKPNKIRGDRTDLLLYEEAGSWPDLTKAFTQADALVGTPGHQWGIRILGGTGGDTGPALEGLRKMYYKPHIFGILPYRHRFSQTGEQVLTAYFMPCFKVIKYKGFTDERGWTDPVKGKEFYERNRDVKAEDSKELVTYSAEYCFNAEEAFSLEGDNKFNKVIIAEQLAAIRLHKNAPEVETGQLSFVYKNRIHSKENIEGYSWQVGNHGMIQILEHPVWTDLYREQRARNGEEPATYDEMHNLYVAGIDGIDIGQQDTSENTDDPSKFCIVIKKRAFGINEPQYVAVYKDRPDDVRDAYKIAMCLIMYYKAIANIEATKIGMLTWAKQKKFFNYFMARPDATYPAGTQTRKKTVGTPATPAVIDHQTDLIRDYVNDSGHTIWFEDMLDELMRYTDENKTHFDIIAAMGMAELADEQLGTITPVKVKKVEEVQGDVGYYVDEKGIKRWGVIPNQNKVQLTTVTNDYESGRRTSDPRTWGAG